MPSISVTLKSSMLVPLNSFPFTCSDLIWRAFRAQGHQVNGRSFPSTSNIDLRRDENSYLPKFLGDLILGVIIQL